VIIIVAICTLNRDESPRRTLRSLAEMNVPDDLVWEVVVVNNNCTDDTDMVIEAFADGQLPIRRGFQPRRGLSLARNRAVDRAKGDYIAWIDDDVIVEPGQLAAYADSFRRWSEAAIFVGPITPQFIPPLPKWFADAEPYLSGRVFARRDVDKEGEILLAEERIPYGPTSHRGQSSSTCSDMISNSAQGRAAAARRKPTSFLGYCERARPAVGCPAHGSKIRASQISRPWNTSRTGLRLWAKQRL
jgi:glycosyltransferase involved in cell wall biosynthesis